MTLCSSGSRGPRGKSTPPDPVKISHKKMAADCGHIDIIFLGSPLTRLDPLLLCVDNFPIKKHEIEKILVCMASPKQASFEQLLKIP